MRWMGGVFLAMAIAGASAQDEVVLKNGDRVTGKLLGLSGGKLRLETAHSGVLAVDWAQVASVRTEGGVVVRLQSGEVVEGKLSAGAAGRLKVESGALAQPAEIDPANVKSFNEPPVQWHGAVDLAARASDGNTRTQSFLATVEGTRATEKDEFAARAIFRYGKQDGLMTERNSYGLAQYRYFFSSDFYVYGSGELASDTFRDLRLRTIVSAGGGVVLLKSDAIDLSLQAGVAYFDNNFRDADDESHVGGRLVGHLRVALPLGFQLTDDVTMYPNFEDTPDWQLRNEASVSTALGAGWTLKAGVITDYDNRVPDGLEKVDDIYFLGLGYRF